MIGLNGIENGVGYTEVFDLVGGKKRKKREGGESVKGERERERERREVWGRPGARRGVEWVERWEDGRLERSVRYRGGWEE